MIRLELHVEGLQKTRIRVPVIRRWRLEWGYFDLGSKPFTWNETRLFDDAVEQVYSFKVGPFLALVSVSPLEVEGVLSYEGISVYGFVHEVAKLPFQKQFKGKLKEAGILSYQGDLLVAREV